MYNYVPITPNLSPDMINRLTKFQKVLTAENFKDLETIIDQLSKRQITRQQFDQEYYTIFVPYVIPFGVPLRFLNKQIIYIHPYTVLGVQKDILLDFFQATISERQDIIKQHPTLLPILIQIVKHEQQVKQQVRQKAKQQLQQLLEQEQQIQQQRQQLQQLLEQEQQIQQLVQNQEPTFLLPKNSSTHILEKPKNNTLFLQENNSEKEPLDSREEDNENSMKCILCCKNRKNIVYWPCSHMVQCDKCPLANNCLFCHRPVSDKLVFQADNISL